MNETYLFEYGRLFFSVYRIVPLAALVKLTAYMQRLLFCMRSFGACCLGLFLLSVSEIVFSLSPNPSLVFQGFDKLKDVVNKWAESPSAA